MMIIRYLILLTILAFMVSCGQKKTNQGSGILKPDTIIPRDTMVRMLTDLHLTEASLSFLKSKGSQEKDLTEKYYGVLFQRYRVSRNLFESNYNYYNADREEFIRMYEEVVKNLETMAGKKDRSAEE